MPNGTESQAVADLLKSSDEFRRLHEEHASLDAKVDRLQRSNNPPIADADIENIKKQRLRLKDRMARLIEHHRAGKTG